MCMVSDSFLQLSKVELIKSWSHFNVMIIDFTQIRWELEKYMQRTEFEPGSYRVQDTHISMHGHQGIVSLLR